MHVQVTKANISKTGRDSHAAVKVRHGKRVDTLDKIAFMEILWKFYCCGRFFPFKMKSSLVTLIDSPASCMDLCLYRY